MSILSGHSPSSCPAAGPFNGTFYVPQTPQENRWLPFCAQLATPDNERGRSSDAGVTLRRRADPWLHLMQGKLRNIVQAHIHQAFHLRPAEFREDIFGISNDCPPRQECFVFLNVFFARVFCFGFFFVCASPCIFAQMRPFARRMIRRNRRSPSSISKGILQTDFVFKFLKRPCVFTRCVALFPGLGRDHGYGLFTTKGF